LERHLWGNTRRRGEGQVTTLRGKSSMGERRQKRKNVRGRSDRGEGGNQLLALVLGIQVAVTNLPTFLVSLTRKIGRNTAMSNIRNCGEKKEGRGGKKETRCEALGRWGRDPTGSSKKEQKREGSFPLSRSIDCEEKRGCQGNYGGGSTSLGGRQKEATWVGLKQERRG